MCTFLQRFPNQGAQNLCVDVVPGGSELLSFLPEKYLIIQTKVKITLLQHCCRISKKQPVSFRHGLPFILHVVGTAHGGSLSPVLLAMTQTRAFPAPGTTIAIFKNLRTLRSSLPPGRITNSLIGGVPGLSPAEPCESQNRPKPRCSPGNPVWDSTPSGHFTCGLHLPSKGTPSAARLLSS